VGLREQVKVFEKRRKSGGKGRKKRKEGRKEGRKKTRL
jgi:hypothetical protein